MMCILVLFMLKATIRLALPGEASIMDKRLLRLSHQLLAGTHYPIVLNHHYHRLLPGGDIFSTVIN